MKPSKLILVGASTGGPGEISTLIGELPALLNTSVIIAQHMPESFLQNFAASLTSQTNNSIFLVEDAMELQAGNIYVLPHSFELEHNREKIFFHTQTKNTHYNPDINLLTVSALPLTNEMQMLVVILTGIGEDGVKGSYELAKKGVRVLTEDGAETIVDGMPAKIRRDIVSAEASTVEKIIEKVKDFCV